MVAAAAAAVAGARTQLCAGPRKPRGRPTVRQPTAQSPFPVGAARDPTHPTPAPAHGARRTNAGAAHTHTQMHTHAHTHSARTHRDTRCTQRARRTTTKGPLGQLPVRGPRLRAGSRGVGRRALIPFSFLAARGHGPLFSRRNENGMCACLPTPLEPARRWSVNTRCGSPLMVTDVRSAAYICECGHCTADFTNVHMMCPVSRCEKTNSNGNPLFTS